MSEGAPLAPCNAAIPPTIISRATTVDTGLHHGLQPRATALLCKRLIYLGLPGISEVGLPAPAGCGAQACLPCPPCPCCWMINACTLPLSDSTRDTPVVMSTSR